MNNGNGNKPVGLFLSNKTYNRLKFFTGIVLPAAGTLYFGLASIWHLPAAQQVLGTIVAVQAFLGALLGISTNQYGKSGAKYDGTINVTQTPDKTLYSLDLNQDPSMLENKSEVSFKVAQNPPSQPKQGL